MNDKAKHAKEQALASELEAHRSASDADHFANHNNHIAASNATTECDRWMRINAKWTEVWAREDPQVTIKGKKLHHIDSIESQIHAQWASDRADVALSRTTAPKKQDMYSPN